MDSIEYIQVFKKVQKGEINREEASKRLKELWEAEEKYPILYATPEWKKVIEVEIGENNTIASNIIIFNFDILPSSLQQKLNANKNLNIVAVSQGDNYKERNKNTYELNCEDKDHLYKLVHSFNNLKGYQIFYIFKQYKEITEENIYNILNKNIIPLFIITQILIKLKTNYLMNISCIFESTETYLHSIYSGLAGFARTLKEESKKVSCSIFETDNVEKNFDKIITLAYQPDIYYPEIKIINNNIYKKNFRAINSNDYYKQAISFKKNGLYLITGGTGSLGFIFSEFLVREYNANLILIGLHPLDTEKKKKIKQLEDRGSEVLFIQADITNFKEIQKVLFKLKGKSLRLDGIIHTAGIIKDSYINNKNKDEIYTVIAPKVMSSIYLDLVTKDEKLDFFILFSSIAVLGNPGQSDYAFANSFMDDFSHIRNLYMTGNKRYGKTISINWPYWEEGGMQIDDKTIQLLEKTKGIRPLKTINGIKAVEYALETQCDQIAVIPGNIQKIFNSLLKNKDIEKKETDILHKTIGNKHDDSIIRSIQDFIIEQVSTLLKVQKDDIDATIDMNEYGFDSINFTDLTNIINSEYDLTLTPAVFFEHATISSFVQYLLKEYKDTFYNNVDVSDLKSDIIITSISENIKKFLINEIATMLKIEIEDIDIEVDMNEYGFDSIGFTNLANSVNSKYNIDITPAIFFEHSTIKSFIEFLLSNYHKELIADINEYKVSTSNNDFIAEDEIPETFDNENEIIYKNNHRFLTDESFNSQRYSDNFITEEPIAITGMAGIMPGANNLDKFWKNLEEGKDCITEIPPDRWDWREYWGDPATEMNKTDVKWGGFLKDVDKFDAGFFKISPREAITMDPQHRLFLEVVWNTIEDAGYKPSSLANTYTGLFVGVGAHDYSELLDQSGIPIDSYMTTGTALSVLPNRISYLLNFHGPSEPIDTACSSSLIAIHRAVKAIQTGDCEQAIAGGVQLNLSPKLFISFSKAGMLSKDGRCKTFDASANGYVRGEGVGAIFLKPLSKALADNDHIYAVVRGTAENHGGLAKSLTAPNPNAQAEVIVKAFEKANIDPSTVSYIEAHGTGTSLGDPIEINGLIKAYKELYEKWDIKDYGSKQHCGIGAVKTNIGHLESAAGIAGILKILLAMKMQKLPKTVHLKKVNPYIKIDNSPFYIIREIQEWKHIKDERGNNVPYRAGISSFGFGGANSHVVLEEYITEKSVVSMNDKREFLIKISAKTNVSLKLYINNLITWLEGNIGKYQIGDIENTLMFGREEFEQRLVLIVQNEKDLIEKLYAIKNGQNEVKDIFSGSVKKEKSKADNLLEGEIGQEVLKKFLVNKNMKEIAELWVTGLSIDWSLLYPQKMGNLIALPTYSFEKKRYWYTDIILSQNNIESSEKVTQNELSGVYYFTSEWKELSVFKQDTKITPSFKMLMFNFEILSKLSQQYFLFDKSWEIVTVTLGESFQKIKNNIYKLNFRELNQIQELFNSIGDLKDYRIVFLLKHYEDITPENIEIVLNENIIPLFLLVQVLINLKIKFPISMSCIYLSTNTYLDSIYSGLSGFIRTLNQESSLINCKLIETDNFEKSIESIMAEICNIPSYYPEIKIHDNKKFIKRNKEIYVSEYPEDIKLINNGVYLITGGAGGLGLIFTEYLVSKYHVKLILIGRSSLNHYKKEKIKKFIDSGSEVLYLQGDITNINDVQMIVKKSKEKFGHINGILHSAGVINDSLIKEKNIDNIMEVLTPKILGVHNIDIITKDEDLDFFVLFSSIAVMGNPGQSDYAYANSCMDNFATLRNLFVKEDKRRGKTVSINWPFWEKGGMSIDSQSVQIMEKTTGILPLKTQDGIKSLNFALNIQSSCLMVIPGNKQRIKNFLTSGDIKPQKVKRKIVVKQSEINLHESVLNNITDAVSGILMVPIPELDVNANFGDYGFDSISLKEFSEKLNKLYDLALAPTVFFAQNNIDKLTSFIIQEYVENVRNVHSDNSLAEDEMVIEDEDYIPKQILEIESAPAETKKDKEVAIIGISGRFPGSKDFEEFWQHLKKQDCLVTEIPKDRWNWENFYGDPVLEENKTFSKWGAFINDVDKFDPMFFKIPPSEIELMDPQHRLFLLCAWEAFEDAGYKVSGLAERYIGIYVGVQFFDYIDIIKRAGKLSAKAGTGNAHSMLANRLSFIFNFHGPSVAIDTACSSSLFAFHQAVKSIQSGESEMAIAGGVSLMLTPESLIGVSKMGIISPDGQCKTFDKSANGYVKGEGIHAFLLKPLEKAIKDKDHIYAVVKGTAVNHGGQAHSLTAPNSEAQADLIVAAFNAGEIDPQSVSYIECHGTGTELGDPVEVNGLIAAFKKLYKEAGISSPKTNYCGLGSVKTNIGHLEPAAGTAGLMKLILSLKYKKIPGLATFKEVNPYLKLENSPFYLVEKTIEWKQLQDENGNKIPRRAGVSSFGFGGANAHVVLEEYIREDTTVSVDSKKEYLIILSAKTMNSLKTYASDLMRWLENSSDKKQLTHLEYTMLTGREEFEERLAIIAKDNKDLLEKLNAFSSGKIGIEDVFSDTIKKDRNRSVKILDDDAGKEYIIKLINTRQIRKIAELWISGFSIDWNLYLKDTKGTRISLPTYPFEKKRYWIEKLDEVIQTQGYGKYIHPLIDYNDSNLYEQKFVKEFLGREKYLIDHMVKEQKVLPEAVYLEYARVAGEAAIGKKIVRFNNVVWKHPFIVDKDGKKLNIRLYPGKNKIGYDFYGAGKNEKDLVIYSQGELLYNENNAEKINKFEINSLKKNLNKSIESDACYNYFQNNGVRYGNSLRVIKKVHYNRDSILAYLEIDDELLRQYKEYTLVPSLMDGALQSIIGFCIEEKPAKVYYPFTLGVMEIINPLVKKCIVSIQKNKDSGLDAEAVNCDLHILNETGTLLIKIHNLVLRESKQVQIEPSVKIEGETGHFYIKDNWVESTLEKKDTKIKSIVLFDTDDRLYPVIKKQYKEGTIILVTPGDDYREIGEMRYEINLNKQDNYTKLLKELKEKGIAIEKIIHNTSKDDFSFKNTEKQIEQSFYSLFHLCKELFGLKFKGNIQIVYVYNKESESVNSGISGFARSACLENTRIQMKVIGFDKDNVLNVPEKIGYELREQKKQCEEIYYKGTTRYIKQFGELDLEKESKEEYKLKEDGVYIITGGAGGLGLLFAEYIAGQGKARLILTGRSKLKDDREQRIKKIENLGAEVLYKQADVTKEKDIKQLVKEIKTLYGRIDGIIHAAGLIRDNYIVKKTDEEVDAVIAPKIFGTLNLDEILKDEELDFFVLFSSMAAMGNVGQSDYAYANSFMDSFAEMRNALVRNKKRSGKTLSINWPLWKEGGMHVDTQTEEYMYNSTGMLPLSSKTGIEAFIKGLTLSVNHFAIVEGNVDKIKNYLFHYPDNSQTETNSVLSGEVNEEEIKAGIENFLVKTIADILDIEGEDLEH